VRSLIDLEEFKQDEAFVSVQRWTRGVDLFTKEWIFIPICYGLHWSLVIIVNAPELAKKLDQIDLRLRETSGVKRPGSLDATSDLPCNLATADDEMKPNEEEEEEEEEEREETKVQEVAEFSKTSDIVYSISNDDDENDNADVEDLTSDIQISRIPNTANDSQFAAALEAGELRDEDIHSSSFSSSSTNTSHYFVSPIYKSLLEFIPKSKETTPAVILLDSLGCHDANQVLPIIRSYIIREWRFRKNGGQHLGGIDSVLTIDERNKLFPLLVPESAPICQSQDNTSDCGLFTVKFVESFVKFSNAAQSPTSMRISAESITRSYLSGFKFPEIIKSWFTVGDVYHLRAIIKTVCNMCKGSDENGKEGETNLQKLSHPRMVLNTEDGDSALVACKMEALDIISPKHQNAVRKKIQEIEKALIKDSRDEPDQNIETISLNDSEDEVEEILKENVKKKEQGKIESTKMSSSSMKRKRHEENDEMTRKRHEENDEKSPQPNWEQVRIDAVSHREKSHRSVSVPFLPPPPPPPSNRK
jgi:hypothetical protein